ncbi:MAG: Oligopeptide ABC transporter, ATP-binding protein OppF (TC 3.A.1.5.1) [uncultured Paraburkholderia sp.]|uniref:ABC transporter ATP-binding protein n=1 Tax=uncultured Paraburkholderia sp. TaxID=1822466 RepID=UPI00259937DF|nr:oligopeptide/dipeptide ABC transporter ATP-binding protein [uncultured Paraburkholderia sp.]CAH2901574.1 MAG: Oligopeptide ABC transporter, ATP-binding protein OppF (TC 3.A.1.5.1) [uncultured Paraburkholderia sp.]CAH2934682.1 MAG: Oligopeptide ABC transporter, ATP-binding protein OppF (TC 3.A.1.5.1) [uncultured Paraburkholderia sp.]
MRPANASHPASHPASHIATPIIEASALTKRFGGERQMFTRTPTVHAVNEVSFAVHTGETFAIVGESGCGKSTLGRMLLRLIDATQGRVLYQGEDITHWQGAKLRRLRRDMQIIFQDPFASLNPGMTVGQIIGEPVGFHGLASSGSERRERVAQLLTKVGLQPAYAQRYPHEFSGGQRQRIGIARALAGEPKLIVGDEPVSALDVSVQAQVINLLESLKAELGLTLIMVAHDLAVIRHMSDRVAVMYLGEIVELAQVDELFDAPLHPYTQALLRAIPASSPHERRTKPALQGDLPSPTAPPPGCRFHTRCPHAKPRCVQERPLSETLPGGRQVACHFWRDVQNAGGGTPLVASVSTKLNERLAIYREKQNQTQAAPSAEANR